jgi:aspartate/glutamate racemase
VIVLGCTEIPFGMERQVRSNPTRFVDSNDALVEAVIESFAPAATP